MRSLLSCLLVLSIAACSKSAHHATPGKLTKADLVAAAELVVAAYPAPYDETYPKVVDALGPPTESKPNLKSWFATDQGCWQLFVTESEHKAAANVFQPSSPADCK